MGCYYSQKLVNIYVINLLELFTMELDYTNIILAIIALFAPVITHKLDKKRHRTEIDQLKAEVEKIKSETMSSTVNGLGSAVDVYQDLVAGIKEELNELRESNTVLRNEINAVRSENDSLKNDINTLNGNIIQLNQYLCTVPCSDRKVNTALLNCIYLQDREKAKDSVKTSKTTRKKNKSN